MPLSEHEQRLLEQMERALYAEDPKFATVLEGGGLRTYTRRRVYQAIAGFLVGVALLIAGMMSNIAVSVIGFLVMLGCAMLAVTAWRRSPKPGEAPLGGTGRGGRRSGRPRRKFTDRIEERWQRRRDEQQGH